MSASPRLVVTGASGRLGQRIVGHLRQRHGGPLVATTRRPQDLAALQAGGVEVVGADFDDPPSLERAFRGADRLLIVSTDAHDVPGRRLRQHENAVAAAKRAGVGHVLYTSLTRCEPGSPMKIAPDHWATEQALAASGLRHTVLRNNLYAEITLEFLPQALRRGQLTAAAGDGAVAWIARDDVARAAAAALHQPPDGSVVLDITGPAPVPYAELAATAARIARRPLAYQPMTAQDIAFGMARGGLPPHVIEVLLSFQLAAARGDLACCTDTVAQLTGQPARSLDEFLGAHAAVLEEGA